MSPSSYRAAHSFFISILFCLLACGTQVGNPSGSDEQTKKNSGANDSYTPTEGVKSGTDGASAQSSSQQVCKSYSILTSTQASSSTGKISILVSAQNDMPVNIIVTHPDLSTSVGNSVSPTVLGTYHFLISAGASATCIISTEVNESNLISAISVSVEELK
jgi:hypothetical protein